MEFKKLIEEAHKINQLRSLNEDSNSKVKHYVGKIVDQINIAAKRLEAKDWIKYIKATKEFINGLS